MVTRTGTTTEPTTTRRTHDRQHRAPATVVAGACSRMACRRAFACAPMTGPPLAAERAVDRNRAARRRAPDLRLDDRGAYLESVEEFPSRTPSPPCADRRRRPSRSSFEEHEHARRTARAPRQQHARRHRSCDGRRRRVGAGHRRPAAGARASAGCGWTRSPASSAPASSPAGPTA